MNENKGLEKAQQRIKEMRENGETLVRLDPVEKARQDTGSLRKAINAFCFQCIYDGQGSGHWRKQVEDCTAKECPLYPIRPISNQK